MFSPDKGYTTFVTTAKIVLPLVAIGLLASLFLVQGPPDETSVIPYSDVELDEIVSGQRLGGPEFRGTTAGDYSVQLVADEARPDPEQASTILAIAVAAIVRIPEGDEIRFRAGTGRFDQIARVATGSDGVTLRHSGGYEMRSDAVRAKIDTVDLETLAPVTLTSDTMVLEAGKLHAVAESGSGALVLDFTGGVKLIYTPKAGIE